MADLDVDEIMQKQVEQLEKEKRELLERLKGQEKKVTAVYYAGSLKSSKFFPITFKKLILLYVCS